MTVSEAYRKWQNEYWTVPSNILENTTRGYLSIYSHHLLNLIGNNEIGEIDLDKIQAYFNSLSKQGYSSKTLKNIAQALDSLLSWCWMKRFLKMPVAIKQYIIFPKKRGGNNVKNVITVEEYSELAPYLSGQYKFALQFLAATGIRVEEIAIRKKNVDFKKHIIYICTAVKRIYVDYNKKKTALVVSDYLKTNVSYRVIPMTPDVEEIVKNQMKYLDKAGIDSDILFCSSTGTPIDPRNILRAFHTALYKAHLPQRGLHSLRKMYIYNMVKKGMDPKILQKLVGHEDYSTTMKYYLNITDNDAVDEAFKIYNENKKSTPQ